MKRAASLLIIASLAFTYAAAQAPTPASLGAISPAPVETPTAAPAPTPLPQLTPKKRGWLGKMLHPFSGGSPKKYKNPKLRGLVLELQVSPQMVNLSEVRQLEVKLMVTNRSKRAIELDFPTDQRIEVQLLNPADEVLTKWSDNHAVTEKPSSVLINPLEKIEYTENIATRDLTPNKVFTVEVFFPSYPELRMRHKFLTAP